MLGLCWPLVVGWLMWLCVLVMCNVLLDGAIELGALCWWLQSAIVTQMYELLSYFQKAIRGDLPRLGALQVVVFSLVYGRWAGDGLIGFVISGHGIDMFCLI